MDLLHTITEMHAWNITCLLKMKTLHNTNILSQQTFSYGSNMHCHNYSCKFEQ